MLAYALISFGNYSKFVRGLHDTNVTMAWRNPENRFLQSGHVESMPGYHSVVCVPGFGSAASRKGPRGVRSLQQRSAIAKRPQ